MLNSAGGYSFECAVQQKPILIWQKNIKWRERMNYYCWTIIGRRVALNYMNVSLHFSFFLYTWSTHYKSIIGLRVKAFNVKHWASMRWQHRLLYTSPSLSKCGDTKLIWYLFPRFSLGILFRQTMALPVYLSGSPAINDCQDVNLNDKQVSMQSNRAKYLQKN